ncbi:MAG: ornithine cyclodeaminase family protein [Cyclobacteriaceae bacterium]|nr:ornithine cyclodeaminase family protein [Cyclobacteriaceae bacterium]
MHFIDSEDIEKYTDYPMLIEMLRDAFQKQYKIPKRHHHQYPNPKEGVESTLLLMPAWDDGENLGVKVVNVSPNNSKHNLPTIQGKYLLFDLQTGTPKAILDAKSLTNKRTAAASALASGFLSREDASCLLMIGNGALAPELIKAHTVTRPITKVYLWGRNFEKSESVSQQLSKLGVEIIPIKDYIPYLGEADIISCATLSPTPLIFGKHIKAGQHYDLVGAYKPDMREADDEFISSVSIHVDNYEGATTETGDLAIPLREGVITRDHILSELFELCRSEKVGRKDDKEITCFKSVGHALEDLAGAKLVFDAYEKR